MKRITLGLAAVALGVLAIAPAQAAAPRLVGTVGPGYTIKLTKGGTKVTKLKSGRYTFVINDKSSMHSYGLDGPNGFAKDFTSVSFKGTKTIAVTLKKGKYKFYCQPHESFMFGNFTVS